MSSAAVCIAKLTRMSVVFSASTTRAASRWRTTCRLCSGTMFGGIRNVIMQNFSFDAGIRVEVLDICIDAGLGAALGEGGPSPSATGSGAAGIIPLATGRSLCSDPSVSEDRALGEAPLDADLWIGPIGEGFDAGGIRTVFDLGGLASRDKGCPAGDSHSSCARWPSTGSEPDSAAPGAGEATRRSSCTGSRRQRPRPPARVVMHVHFG